MLAYRVNVNILVFAEDHGEAMDLVYDDLDGADFDFEIIECRQAMLVDIDEGAAASPSVESLAEKEDEEN